LKQSSAIEAEKPEESKERKQLLWPKQARYGQREVRDDAKPYKATKPHGKLVHGFPSSTLFDKLGAEPQSAPDAGTCLTSTGHDTYSVFIY
jgi:hypothetical protein